MIKKINKIINIGSFLNFDWDLFNPINKIDRYGNLINDDTGNPKIIDSRFNKYNILYGENGSGKSTLVKIFKAINTNNETYLNKNWDKADKDREISLEVDSVNVNFNENTKWQKHSLTTNIIDFDRDYVNDYIHTGNDRTSQHDKNTGNLILYLGDFYNYVYQLDMLVELLNNVNVKQKDFKTEYDSQKQDFEKCIKNPDVIYKHYNTIKETESFKIAHIKQLLSLQKEVKDKELKILSRSDDILNLKDIFEEITTPLNINPSQGNILFNFSVTSGIIEASKRIENKQTFIEQGTKIVNESKLKNCPYCEQGIVEINGNYIKVVNEYQTIFDDEFLKSQKNIESNLELYKQSLQSILNFQEPKNNNQILSDFNKLFENNIKFDYFSLTQNENSVIKNELTNIDNKTKNILKPFTSTNTENLIAIFSNFDKFIINYNNKINQLNETINLKQEEFKNINVSKKLINTIRILSIIDDLIFSLNNNKLLEYLTTGNKLINSNAITISQISSIVKLFREKINNEFDEFISNYLSTIKKYISLLYPVFEIFEIKKSRGTYDFRNNDVYCGFIVKYNEKDRLKDLSEGEKQIIAIAFYFAMLEKEKNKNDKIVIFDDPITSFDSGKRKQMVELIINNTKEYNQVFILTCDPLFKRYCQKIIPNQKSYYILKSSSSSIFYTPKDVETIYNSFKKDLQEIEKALGTDEDIVEYGQKLRFCIEEIREKYLGHNSDNLSSVLNHVKDVDFDIFKNKLPGLLLLYNYCNTGGLAHFPKDGSTSWVELKNQVKKYLSLSL